MESAYKSHLSNDFNLSRMIWIKPCWLIMYTHQWTGSSLVQVMLWNLVPVWCQTMAWMNVDLMSASLNLTITPTPTQEKNNFKFLWHLKLKWNAAYFLDNAKLKMSAKCLFSIVVEASLCEHIIPNQVITQWMTNIFFHHSFISWLVCLQPNHFLNHL